MAYFRNFTGPLWAMFAGNLLLLFCFLFYLVWWGVTFRPNSSGGPVGALSILAAFITGTAAIVLMCGGINSLSQVSKGLPVRLILLGVAVLFFALLLVTSILFHRIVTSELMIIHLWIALELSAIAVLYGTGNLGPGRAAILAALVLIAFVVSMICYVLYYRLSGMAGYYAGMVPLISAAFVAAVFLGATAFR
ncbi:MAG TPA: hypothetical protein VN381_16915 [Anaerovoracaceae bacterium]|nr:hypothetical protein [Anaerovoracaceae bacterium]